jgi:hypothetical protein
MGCRRDSTRWHVLPSPICARAQSIAMHVLPSCQKQAAGFRATFRLGFCWLSRAESERWSRLRGPEMTFAPADGANGPLLKYAHQILSVDVLVKCFR